MRGPKAIIPREKRTIRAERRDGHHRNEWQGLTANGSRPTEHARRKRLERSFSVSRNWQRPDRPG